MTFSFYTVALEDVTSLFFSQITRNFHSSYCELILFSIISSHHILPRIIISTRAINFRHYFSFIHSNCQLNSFTFLSPLSFFLFSCIYIYFCLAADVHSFLCHYEHWHSSSNTSWSSKYSLLFLYFYVCTSKKFFCVIKMQINWQDLLCFLFWF